MSTQVGLDHCRIVRPQHAGKVEITIADASPRHFPMRVSGSLGIVVKRGPDHVVKSDGRLRRYPRNAVCVRAPGSVWSSEEAACAFLSIDVQPMRLPEDWLGGPMAFAPPNRLGNLAAVARALLTAESELEADGIVDGLVIEVISDGLGASDELRSHTDASRNVERSREFLRASLAARPTLEQAAHAAGTSRFRLLRDFKRALGTTPHRYLVMLRLETARAQLSQGVPVSEVALRSGFSDQAHLTRWFRRLHGITPASYARSVRSVHAQRPSIPFKTT